jgi:hypothetical protein
MKIAFAFALVALGAGDLGNEPPPGMHQASPSDFDFAAAWDSPCAATQNRRAPDPLFAEACKEWSEPQYFHGVWSVGFEESNFTFMGKMDCYKMRDHSCIELRGDALPWPERWDCNREFEVKFIGRRTKYAVPSGGVTSFAVTVDRLIDARRLPAPYNWVCPSGPKGETD